jgi:hypothetical protein
MKKRQRCTDVCFKDREGSRRNASIERRTSHSS